MSNNIYLQNIDPILANTATMARPYFTEPTYPTQQMPYVPKDYIGMLDERLRGLTETERKLLNEDGAFNTLNNTFNVLVQKEIMNLIRTKLNSDGGVVDNINQQMEIINRVSLGVKEQERQNLSMMNDYITNYSNISFAEYQAMRAGKERHVVERPIETVSETTTERTTTEEGKKKFFSK